MPSLDAITSETGPVIKLGVDEIPGSATPEDQRERFGMSSAGIKLAVVEDVAPRVPAL